MKILKYEIFLDFDEEKESFKGKERIILENWSNSLKLDKEDLKILNVTIKGKKADFEEKENSLLVKNVNGDEIEIEFEGKVSKTLSGLYKANYDHKKMFSTQFEAIGARKVFPCVDHPSYKAVFKLSVAVRKPLEVISNEDLEEVKDLGEKRIFIFKETPRMATYLLYIGIGEFEKREIKNEVKIRAIIPKGKDVRKAKFSLETTKKFFDFMQEYFQVKYPLSKLDIIAVPEFAAGAMENFGAITFREFYVLSDKSTSLRQKRRIMQVISHELVHQWFGNLVTMKWWDDLWLNESFASFLEYLPIDSIYPKMKIWREFFDDYSSAMFSDSLLNTHAIKVKVKDIEEIDQIFDAISYSKGASILRMMYHFLGEEKFREVLIDYLNRYKFSNASLDEFSQVLEEKAKAGRLMKEWVKKKGYPILFVKLKNKKITIEQKRFTFLENEDKTIWKIPLFIKTDKGSMVFLLDKKEASFQLNYSFLFLNEGSKGFYRVFYDEKLLNKIIKNKDKLSEEEKTCLLDDYFSFMLSGLISVKKFLKLVENFIYEKDFLVVDNLIDFLSFLNKLLPNEKIRRITLRFLEYQYRRLLKEKDYLLLGPLATLYSKLSEDFNKRMLKQKDYFKVLPDLRLAYAISLVKVKGKDGFNYLLSLIDKCSDEDRIKIFTALFYSKEEGLRALAYSLLLTKSKKQDLPILIPNSFSNLENVEIGWIWVKENLKDIMEMFKGSYQPRRILEGIIPIVGLYKEKELLEYLKKNKFEYAKMGIKNGLEMLKVYKRFLNRNKNLI